MKIKKEINIVIGEGGLDDVQLPNYVYPISDCTKIYSIECIYGDDIKMHLAVEGDEEKLNLISSSDHDSSETRQNSEFTPGNSQSIIAEREIAHEGIVYTVRLVRPELGRPSFNHDMDIYLYQKIEKINKFLNELYGGKVHVYGWNVWSYPKCANFRADTKFMIKIESVMYPVMNYKYSPIVKSSEDHIDSAVSKFLTDQLFPLLMKIKMD